MTTAAEDRIAAIRHCVMDQGLTFDATAKALGLSIGQVNYSAKQGGIVGIGGRYPRAHRPRHPNHLTYDLSRRMKNKDRDDRVISLLKAGHSCPEVSLLVRTTRATVYQIAKKAGVSYPDMRHNRGSDKEERNESITALLREGVTCRAIAERFGVSGQRVHQIAMKAGLVLPNSWKLRRAENKRLLRAKRDAAAKRKADVRQKVLDYGLTFRAAARALGLTPAQVAYTAKTVGIRSPQAPRKS